MRRRLILFFGTVLVLAAGCVVYWLVAGGQKYLGAEGARAPSAGETPGQTEVDTGLFFVARDEQGRREGIYHFPEWEKRDDGSYVVTRPRIELFQKNGQRLEIRADTGTIYAEELSRGVNPRRGSLVGNVRILFDRSTDPDAGPAEDRPQDMVRIFVDSVEFDNDLLEISTDSNVTVFSREADILGRGLVIRWNEDPDELRTLKVRHGELMAIYEAEDFDVVSLPGSGREESSPTEQARSAPAPLSESEALEAFQALSSSEASSRTRPATASAPTSRPAAREPSAATTSAPAAATLPGEDVVIRLTGARAPRQNIFRATFHDRVRVDSGDRHLDGAESLSLVFEWGGERRESLGRRGGDSATQPSGARELPGSPDTRAIRDRNAARTQPATGPVRAAGLTAQATTRPTGRQGEPMIITWTGPLVLEPIGHTETPSDKRFEVSAKGENLTLSDGRAKAFCREFTYRHPQMAGRLAGADGAPVRLELGGGDEVVCPEIRFSRQKELGLLIGPGHIATTGREGAAFGASSSTQPSGGRISWEQSVAVRFDAEPVRDDDGTTRSLPFINEAIFFRNVELTSAGTSDFMRCDDNLHVWMTKGQAGWYPGKAVATGNVRARQERTNETHRRAEQPKEVSDILADEVTVNFEEVVEDTPDGAKRRRQRPKSMTAVGNVTVTTRRGDDVTTATADSITADVTRQSAVLKGKPARIVQGQNEITGPEIHLTDSGRPGGEAATVKGAGGITFVTDRNFAGQKLDKPRPVGIAWSEQMAFDGKRNKATFTGGVALSTGMNYIACKEMTATFKTVAEDASGAASADKGSGLALGVGGLGARRIETVNAKGEVSVRSIRMDQRGRTLQRLKLLADSLHYDAASGQIDCYGYGTLLAEDYRSPKRDDERAGAAATGVTGGIDRPWQTAFEWHKEMHLAQKTRSVNMSGRVGMWHRSGGHVLRDKKLKVPDWGELAEGRTTILGCEQLSAEFAPPRKLSTTRPAAAEALDFDATSRVGPLELFTATRDVSLQDGPFRLEGKRLTYRRSRGQAVLWGYLPGDPIARRTKAVVMQEDPDGATIPVRSEMFQCILDEKGHVKKIVIPDATAGGNR